MNTLFKNNYRIKSARLQNWDYSAEAAYFMHFFGEIKNNEMILSALGNEVANA
jgi:putative transposase